MNRLLLITAAVAFASPASADSIKIGGTNYNVGVPSGEVPAVGAYGLTPNWGAAGVTSVTGSFGSASPSAAFSPVAGRPFVISVSGALPASLIMKCSLDSGVTYAPIIAENTTLYQPTVAGLWSYEAAVTGTMCRLEWSGTAGGSYKFAQ